MGSYDKMLKIINFFVFYFKIIKIQKQKNLKYDCIFFFGYFLLNIDKLLNLFFYIFFDFDKVRLDYLIVL